jgi:hypothetical protein
MAKYLKMRHHPVLGSGTLNTLLHHQRRVTAAQGINMHQHRNCWMICFLCGPTQGYITMAEVTSGVYLGHPVPRGYKYRDLALHVGGVSNETVKYGREFCGTSIQE